MFARIVLIMVLASAAAGCGGADGANGDRADVAASPYPIAWAAGRIAGAARVVSVVPPGVEPHDVELGARDVELLRAADTVLYVGGGLMPALEDAVAGDTDAVDLLAGVDALPAGDGADPHVWLDPVRFAAIAERIGATLGRPQAGRDLAAELRALDRTYRAGLAGCARRTIVTSHAAFGYLADRYGLRQVSLAGVSPEAEPSPRALERLVDDVRASGATTVFFEPLVAPDVARTVAREAGVRTATLDPVESLPQDALDAGEDYLTAMRANLAALRGALGCP